MPKYHTPQTQFFLSREAGIERVQLVLLLAVAIALAFFLGPTLLKKSEVESEIRMKGLLRAFHSANQAYRTQNRTAGFAQSISDLVRDKKRPYLGTDWLQATQHGFSVAYHSPDSVPRQTFSLWAQRNFYSKLSLCMDQRGVLRADAIPGASSSLIADDAGCHGGIEVV